MQTNVLHIMTVKFYSKLIERVPRSVTGIQCFSLNQSNVFQSTKFRDSCKIRRKKQEKNLAERNWQILAYPKPRHTDALSVHTGMHPLHTLYRVEARSSRESSLPESTNLLGTTGFRETLIG